MKTQLAFASLLLSVISLTSAHAQQVTDFESLTGFNSSGPTGQFFDGYSGAATTEGFEVDGLSFPTAPFGPGWSYSQVVDTTDPEFTNQFAAFPGSGSGGSATYALAFGSGSSFTSQTTIQSLDITNTTFAFLALRDGNQFSTAFGGDDGTEPDFFSLNITGFDSSGEVTGSMEYFLADFRFDDSAQDFIVDSWETVDVSGLNATTLSFDFDSSDTFESGVNTFLNTPTYFAADNIVVAAVAIPEPGSLLLIATAGFAGVLRRRRSIS